MKDTKNLTILLAILALTMSGAESRTFTNTAGKQVVAELVGLENGAAILQLGNGRKATVPLDSLSGADQLYVKAWHEEHRNRISENDLGLTIRKMAKRVSSVSSESSESSGSSSDGDGGGCRRGGRGGTKSSSKSSTSETTYACTLKNSSTKTVEGMKATYTIYKRISVRGDGGSETTIEKLDDTIDLEVLKSRGMVEFVTKPVECLDSSQKSKNGPSETRSESIKGFVVTLTVGGREILREGHPDNFLDRLEEEAKREQERAKVRR